MLHSCCFRTVLCYKLLLFAQILQSSSTESSGVQNTVDTTRADRWRKPAHRWPLKTKFYDQRRSQNQTGFYVMSRLSVNTKICTKWSHVCFVSLSSRKASSVFMACCSPVNIKSFCSQSARRVILWQRAPPSSHLPAPPSRPRAPNSSRVLEKTVRTRQIYFINEYMMGSFQMFSGPPESLLSSVWSTFTLFVLLIANFTATIQVTVVLCC